MRESSCEVTRLSRPRAMPGPEPYALRVLIYRAGCYCGSEVFCQPEVLIGRHPGSDLQLPCEMVSLAHAVVSVRRDGLRIDDSGSKNGIRVNQRWACGAELADGDEVELGTFVLRFQLFGDRPAPAALVWDADREDTIEDDVQVQPEPPGAGLFPMADMLEPTQSEAEILYRWSHRHGGGRIGPVREVG